MANAYQKKAILKRMVKDGGGGPGWDKIKNLVKNFATGAKDFVKGRIDAAGKINEDREKSYYKPATPEQVEILKKSGKTK